MATYPYSRAKEIGWAYGEILTSAQMSTVDDNAASGADGSLWTDYAVAQTWMTSVAVADCGLVLHWSDHYKQWFSFGATGGNPVAATKNLADTAFVAAASIQAGAGLTPLCAAESSSGVIIVGGTPGSGSTQKMRRKAVGGAWALETTTASSTEGVRGVCWHSGASLFIAGLDNTAATNIETSPDGDTWTQRTGLANTNPRGSIASNGTIAVIMPYNTSTNKCLTTTDGVTYTERTLSATVTWAGVHWDSVNERFVAYGDSTVSYSDDGITWASATGSTGSAYQRSAIMGRVLLGANTGGGTVYIANLTTAGVFDDIPLREISGGPTITAVAAANEGVKQIMFATDADVHYWTVAGGSLFL